MMKRFNFVLLLFACFLVAIKVHRRAGASMSLLVPGDESRIPENDRNAAVQYHFTFRGVNKETRKNVFSCDYCKKDAEYTGRAAGFCGCRRTMQDHWMKKHATVKRRRSDDLGNAQRPVTRSRSRASGLGSDARAAASEELIDAAGPRSASPPASQDDIVEAPPIAHNFEMSKSPSTSPSPSYEPRLQSTTAVSGDPSEDSSSPDFKDPRTSSGAFQMLHREMPIVDSTTCTMSTLQFACCLSELRQCGVTRTASTQIAKFGAAVANSLGHKATVPKSAHMVDKVMGVRDASNFEFGLCGRCGWVFKGINVHTEMTVEAKEALLKVHCPACGWYVMEV